MRRNRESHAGTPPEIDILAGVYRRQFLELSNLRRHILSRLPLRTWKHIVEPGCGTGLLAAELAGLTPASYTGIDLDMPALALAAEKTKEVNGYRFICRDARDCVPEADAYVSSFFLAMLVNPVDWLNRVRMALPEGGVYAVFGEYDYDSITEEPESGLVETIRKSLEEDGFSTGIGGELDEVFRHAGFDVSASGSIRGPLQEPDREFLEFQLGRNHPGTEGVRLSWTVVWGIYTSRED